VVFPERPNPGNYLFEICVLFDAWHRVQFDDHMAVFRATEIAVDIHEANLTR
jgi:hypothetical protein